MNIKAAVVREKSGPFVMEEIQLDEPRADEVVVRVVSAGICHTDLIPREQAIPAPFPAVYGHEGAGVVEKVGSQVAKLKPGDHVVMSFNSCGVCASCKKGEISYCVDHFASNFGFARFSDKSKTMRKGDEVVHGAFFNQSSFASHALGTERTVVKIPSDVPLEIMGPLGCGIQTGAGAVLNSLHPHAGSSIAIFGGGSVGLSALLAAVAVGCTTIILVDVSDERLKFGTELGATHTVNAGQGEPGGGDPGRSPGREPTSRSSVPVIRRPFARPSTPSRSGASAGSSAHRRSAPRCLSTSGASSWAAPCGASFRVTRCPISSFPA